MAFRDFGVSYFQAKQEADRFLIAKERRRKVVQSLAQEVRFAYWKALVAQRTTSAIDKMLTEASSALSRSGQIGKELLKSPVEALQYRRTLLETIRQLGLDHGFGQIIRRCSNFCRGLGAVTVPRPLQLRM